MTPYGGRLNPLRRATLAFLLALVLLPSAVAQVNTCGEIAFVTDTAMSDAFPSGIGWTLAAHLEADYALELSDFPPVAINLVLDPSVRVSEEIAAEPGPTEAYARLSEGAFDVSAGIERLPLEYARLSLPFSVERTLRQGVRQGVPGARVLWYPGNYRLRAALLYQDTPTPLISVKRAFGDFELEGFALYYDQAVFGAGGSGLVGDLVIYGEGWLLTAPMDARGALSQATWATRYGLWRDPMRFPTRNCRLPKATFLLSSTLFRSFWGRSRCRRGTVWASSFWLASAFRKPDWWVRQGSAIARQMLMGSSLRRRWVGV